MLPRRYIRSVLFNFAFYIGTAICALICLPALILPRRMFLWVVTLHTHLITFLEYTILGLRYEVRGREHLPDAPPYIIAAKHQSAYETFKLRVLFDDPAIILKKELLHIPLWGWFLRKSDVIAIDRATATMARQSMNDGAIRAAKQGRPIVLFPQGTRVMPDETAADKPYKSGVYTMHNATNLPVIPMATNTGLFWAKRPWGGFFKAGGTVIFEFLPPIKMGQKKGDFMNELETKAETASNALIDEARTAQRHSRENRGAPWGKIALFITLIIACLVYGIYWQNTAKIIHHEYMAQMQRMSFENPTEARIGGFPFIHLSVDTQTIATPDGSISMDDISARGLPFPFMPVHIKTGAVRLKSYKWTAPLEFDSLDIRGRATSQTLVSITDSTFKRGDFAAKITGTIDTSQKPMPKLDMNIILDKHEQLFDDLTTHNILNKNTATFMNMGLNMLRDKDDGLVHVPLAQRGNALYLGPIPIFKIAVTP